MEMSRVLEHPIGELTVSLDISLLVYPNPLSSITRKYIRVRLNTVEGNKMLTHCTVPVPYCTVPVLHLHRTITEP